MTVRRYKDQILVTVENGIANIKLGPMVGGNRIDLSVATAFQSACHNLMSDPSLRVVLVSAGGTDFCNGGVRVEDACENFDKYRVASALSKIKQPVIAALHGRVIDQGLELALAADIRVAASNVQLVMMQVVEGGFPFDGGTQRLPRIAGPATALDMLLTGRALSGKSALGAGLITELLSLENHYDRAQSIAAQIAKNGAVALRYAKEAVSNAQDLTMAQGLQMELDLSVLLQGTKRRTRAINDFKSRSRFTSFKSERQPDSQA